MSGYRKRKTVLGKKRRAKSSYSAPAAKRARLMPASYRQSMRLGRNMLGIGRSHWANLVYCDSGEFNSASGSGIGPFNFYSVRLNSLFDPDQAVGGHQPFGFDQLAAIYGRYVVTKCYIDIQLVTLNTYARVSVVPTLDATPVPLTFSNQMELPYAVSRLVSSGNNGADICRIKLKYDIARMFGVKTSTILDDDQFQALRTANPARQAFTDFNVQGPNGASTVNMCYIITIRYKCKFMNPVLVTPS